MNGVLPQTKPIFLMASTRKIRLIHSVLQDDLSISRIFSNQYLECSIILIRLYLILQFVLSLNKNYIRMYNCLNRTQTLLTASTWVFLGAVTPLREYRRKISWLVLIYWMPTYKLNYHDWLLTSYPGLEIQAWTRKISWGSLGKYLVNFQFSGLKTVFLKFWEIRFPCLVTSKEF